MSTTTLTSLSGSTFNKPSSISLYQSCRILRDRLVRVNGFDQFLAASVNAPDSPVAPMQPAADDEHATQDKSVQVSRSALRDPVDELWRCFRLGSSLSHLYNATQPQIELAVRPVAETASLNACKKDVYHFLLACKKELSFADDDLFSITELYSENTSGFVKVIKTVSLLLDLLESRSLLMASDAVELKGADGDHSHPAAPQDTRDKVVAELLDTERKYVAHLEILQNFQGEVISREVVPVDTAHIVFANLNALIDFQRRFLISLEATCALPPRQQRIGLVFVQNEQPFSVYEPFCANYARASDLVIEETPRLRKLEHLVEPTYELPSLLIRPIQRICKYPLLLRELLKYSDRSDPFYGELERGMEAIKRVTDRVNETRRVQENAVIVTDLEKRVEDWKGHSIATFGALLLEDTFLVIKGDVEREYRCYLFERILLCCKETSAGKKTGKNISISKKPKKRSGTLQLKGRIFLNNVTDVVPSSRNGNHTLHVYWRGDQDQEFFTLRCRNEENLKQWFNSLSKLLEEVRIQLHEYRSNSTLVSSGAQRAQPSFNYPSSADLYRRGDRQGMGYESDEESHRTEDTFDDHDAASVGSVPMSREASAASTRSRSATNESLPYYNRNGGGGTQMARMPSGSGATPALGPSFPRHLAMDSSVFSPVVTSAESAASGKWGSNHHNGSYPFPNMPHQSQEYDAAVAAPGAGQTRYTAPAMSRSGSRQSDSSQGRGVFARPSNSAHNRPPLQSRMRSTSSPHIHNAGSASTSSIPDMPSAMGAMVNNARMPSMTSSQASWVSNSAESLPPPPPPLLTPAGMGGFQMSTPNSSAGPSPLLGMQVKVKINFQEDIYVIVIPEQTQLAYLREKVERKIRLAGHAQALALDPAGMKLKYRDEDGDLITMQSDEDVAMAIEGLNLADAANATLSLIVTAGR